MRWRDLLAGRTVADASTEPARSPTGRLVLRRLNADALGLRDARTGRAITWDAPEAEALGVHAAAVVPLPAHEDEFADDDATPGSELILVVRRGRVEIQDAVGYRTIGHLRDPDPILRQLDAGIPLRAIVLRRVIDLTGKRSELDVLVVPATVTLELMLADARG